MKVRKKKTEKLTEDDTVLAKGSATQIFMFIFILFFYLFPCFIFHFYF